MAQESNLHFRPPNSDFLIHWTGRDLEPLNEDGIPAWTDSDDSVTDEKLTQTYLERLKSCLKFGLWMTNPQDWELSIAGLQGDILRIPRTCFTELKLSEVRSHAVSYGRLGIGFKRPFVMERGGLPVWYCPPPAWLQWQKSLDLANRPVPDQDPSLCFLKPMGTGPGFSWYKYLYEAEWRIIYSNWLKAEHAVEPVGQDGWSIPPEKSPPYVLSVKSRWLALIIYPSIQVLCRAQQDPEIRQILGTIKPEGTPVGHPLKTAPWERHTVPIELELDNCVNF